MLTNAKIKQIRSLKQKKFREILGQYLIQGEKIVSDAVASGEIPELILAQQDVINKHPGWTEKTEVEAATAKQLDQMSSLKNAPGVLAVMSVKSEYLDENRLAGELCLGLDCIQDPGNMGAILRIADWFGINDVLCSEDTADCYNPKVVQASMGALFRVRVHYVNLQKFIAGLRSRGEYPVYGTFMNGKSVYEMNAVNKGMLLMGNEGNGISSDLTNYCSHKLAIPPFPRQRNEMESLNIAVAAGIFCAEFRRHA
jgi:TrmH family RNA methyltransferase